MNCFTPVLGNTGVRSDIRSAGALRRGLSKGGPKVIHSRADQEAHEHPSLNPRGDRQAQQDTAYAALVTVTRTPEARSPQHSKSRFCTEQRQSLQANLPSPFYPPLNATPEQPRGPQIHLSLEKESSIRGCHYKSGSNRQIRPLMRFLCGTPFAQNHPMVGDALPCI